MPLFSITNLDNDGAIQIRLDNRDAHLAYIKASGDAVKLAGPFLSDDSTTMIGSLLLIEKADLAAAKAWAADDPYAKAGLFKSSVVRPFKQVVPAS